MTLNDVDAVVAVHRAAFAGFFLTGLGSAFLRALYTSILEDPNGLVFISEADGRMNGFVAGATVSQAFYRRILLRRWWRFAAASVLPVLRSPAVAFRLLGELRRVRRQPIPHRGMLLSLVVAPSGQSQGVGRQLTDAFLQEAFRQGLASVELTTDAVDNERVNRFYLKYGFRRNHTFTTRQGRLMNEYVYFLGTQSDEPR